MTWRSLRPLDCSMRMILCALSICLTFSRTTSPARRPHCCCSLGSGSSTDQGELRVRPRETTERVGSDAVGGASSPSKDLVQAFLPLLDQLLGGRDGFFARSSSRWS